MFRENWYYGRGNATNAVDVAVSFLLVLCWTVNIYQKGTRNLENMINRDSSDPTG